MPSLIAIFLQWDPTVDFHIHFTEVDPFWASHGEAAKEATTTYWYNSKKQQLVII
jgi:hypothetical protein